MDYITISSAREQKRRIRREIADWQRGALGLLALSIAANAGLYGLLGRELAGAAELREECEQLRRDCTLAKSIADDAKELSEIYAKRIRDDRNRRRKQAAAYEAVGAWEYVGECTVTAYCPCELCCGQWADGLTAAGLPASPGIIAVDPEIIPLGSTVIMDGQRYLAADTGVTGKHVDVYLPDHAEAEAFGVRAADVWVTAP